jgi:hypothetical protein
LQNPARQQGDNIAYVGGIAFETDASICNVKSIG